MSGPYGHWVPETGFYDPGRPLSVVVGMTPGASSTSPEQVFFFHFGRYVGPATSQPRFAFTIAGITGDTVTVAYSHYQPGDADCCPSLPDYIVRFHWTGKAVTPLGQAPPPDQGM